jgi:hypothetical protein
MQEQRARVEAEEEVLGASASQPDVLTGDLQGEVVRYPPAQSWFMNVERDDLAADDMGLDAAAGSFDFGKLGQSLT